MKFDVIITNDWDKVGVTKSEGRLAHLVGFIYIGLFFIWLGLILLFICLNTISFWSNLVHGVGSILMFNMITGIPLAIYKAKLLGSQLSKHLGKNIYGAVLLSGSFLFSILVLILINIWHHYLTILERVILYISPYILCTLLTFLWGRKVFPILCYKFA